MQRSVLVAATIRQPEEGNQKALKPGDTRSNGRSREDRGGPIRKASTRVKPSSAPRGVLQKTSASAERQVCDYACAGPPPAHTVKYVAPKVGT